MDKPLDQRYADMPVYLFFENFILDAIGELPEDKEALLKTMDLQAIFATQANQWRDVVRETLQLSPTIAICILDNWVRTQNGNPAIDPRQFAKQFVDEYFREGSHLDVWTEQSLREAMNRIKDYIVDGLASSQEQAKERALEEEVEA